MKASLFLRGLFVLLVFGLPFAFQSCSGTGDFDTAKTGGAGDDDDSDDEGELVTPPGQVAGSFLTCAEVEGSDSQSTELMADVGCGLYHYNDGGQITKSQEGVEFERVATKTLWDTTEESPSTNLLAYTFQDQAESMPMHTRFTMPRSKLGKTWAVSNFKDLKLKGIERQDKDFLEGDIITCTIPDWTGCLNSSMSTCDDPNARPAAISAPVAYDAVWNGGDALSVYIDPTYFCSSGNIRDSIQAGLIAVAQNKGWTIETTINKTSGSLTFGSQCFTMMTIGEGLFNGGGGTAFAHQGQGCFFMRSQGKLFIIKDDSRLDAEKARNGCHTLIERFDASAIKNPC